MITEWCGGGIKLNNSRIMVWYESNHIITECWGGGEHEKFCSHKAIKFVCVRLNFFYTAEIFEQFDIGCFAILQMQHVSLWSELCFFAVLQVHQTAWSIIKYMASNHFSMLGTRNFKISSEWFNTSILGWTFCFSKAMLKWMSKQKMIKSCSCCQQTYEQ